MRPCFVVSQLTHYDTLYYITGQGEDDNEPEVISEAEPDDVDDDDVYDEEEEQRQEEAESSESEGRSQCSDEQNSANQNNEEAENLGKVSTDTA